MDTTLPTAAELQKLPLRAIVAYAARTARRVSSELRGVIAEQLMEDVLGVVETALTTDLSTGADKSLLVSAAERVAAAYVETPGSLQSGEKAVLVFSLVQAALTAMHAVLATEDPTNASEHIKRAAECARRAVSPVKSLPGEAAELAMQAAREDYDILVTEYA